MPSKIIADTFLAQVCGANLLIYVCALRARLKTFFRMLKHPAKVFIGDMMLLEEYKPQIAALKADVDEIWRRL